MSVPILTPDKLLGKRHIVLCGVSATPLGIVATLSRRGMTRSIVADAIDLTALAFSSRNLRKAWRRAEACRDHRKKPRTLARPQHANTGAAA